MELKKRYRSTMMRTNARFRGPSSSLDYTNMVNEALHDMILLGQVLDEKRYTEEKNGVEREVLLPGHSTYLRNNFSWYVNGESEGDGVVSSNIESATSLYVKNKEVTTEGGVKASDLSSWVSYGGCTTTTAFNETYNTNGTILTTDGLQTPAGIQIDIPVEEWDVILLRMAVAKIDGTIESVEIGSDGILLDDGSQRNRSFSVFALPHYDSMGYIDHIIECQHRGVMTLQINILHSGLNHNGSFEIFYPEVQKMNKKDLGLVPVNTDIKARTNNLEAEIKNLLR